MKKASNKAYVSKRQIEIYQRERAKQIEEAASGKKFKEDEELKQSDLSKKAEALQDISEEENLSAEEVNSDDLGDDITQTRQQVAPQ
jgi:hypothetical protein